MNKRTATAIAVSLIGSVNAEGIPGPEQGMEFVQHAPPNSFLAHVEYLEHGGEQYTLLKYIDQTDESMIDITIDSSGRLIGEIPDRGPAAPVIESSVLDAITDFIASNNLLDTNNTLTVEIGLSVPLSFPDKPGVHGEIYSGEDGQAITTVNGRIVSTAEASEIGEAALRERALFISDRAEAVNSVRDNLLGRIGVNQSRLVGLDGQADVTGSLVIDLNSTQLAALIANLEDVIYVGFPAALTEDIGSAMAETRVDPYALSRSNHSGSGIGVYMTEPGCPEPTWISNYTRLSVANDTDHSRRVASIIRAVSPDAWVYCRIASVQPQFGDLDGVGGNPPIQIMTMSASTPTAGEYDWTARSWDLFSYISDAAAFTSTGNMQDGTTWVRSPALGANVTGVGSYNDQTDAIAGTSSFQDPETDSLKPELSAPGVNITISGLGTASGTSFSTPHVAAMAADYLEAAPGIQLQAAAIKAAMLAGARRTVSGAQTALALAVLTILSRL